MITILAALIGFFVPFISHMDGTDPRSSAIAPIIVSVLMLIMVFRPSTNRAMALAPMSVVQVVLAGGVALIAVMADRVFGMKVGRRQWWGLGLTALGLALLALTQPAAHGSHSSYTVPAMLSFEAGLFLIGGLLIMGPRVGAPAKHHGMMLGAAAGLLFGVSDVAIKALTGLVGELGFAGLLTPWSVVMVAASVVAFYASARGLQKGEAVPVIAVTGTAANISGILGGILVFGDPMPGDPFGVALQVLAFVLVVAAAAMLPGPGLSRSATTATTSCPQRALSRPTTSASTTSGWLRSTVRRRSGSLER